MDEAEKRRLKKLGKQEIERRSAELENAMLRANPAPIGSDEWVDNYRRGGSREKWLTQRDPLSTRRN